MKYILKSVALYERRDFHLKKENIVDDTAWVAEIN